MKLQERDLRGLSLEELKIRNGLEAAAVQDRKVGIPSPALRPRGSASVQPMVAR
jgi:hypothetical protein